jgi:hypothetical protein
MDAGRPAALVAWIECEVCGRIDQPDYEFNPDDMAEGQHLVAWIPCEQCGRRAKLHMKRETKPAN